MRLTVERLYAPILGGFICFFGDVFLIEVSDKSGSFVMLISERESPSAQKVSVLLLAGFQISEIACMFSVSEERIKSLI